MTVPRYPEKFVSLDGATTYTFGLNAMAVQEAQPVRVPMGVAIGADSQHDFLGYGVSPREPRKLSLNWFIVKSTAALVDTEVDNLKSDLLLIGKGKLYTVGADGSERWIYARIASMPEPQRAPGQFTHIPVSCEFWGFGNWRASAATTGTQSVTTAGTQSFTITNAGNVPVRDAVFRLRANAMQGFGPILVRNSTTGEVIYSGRVADFADSEIKVDGNAQAVFYSSNDGATYADDYAKVRRGSAQAGLISLAPGNNTIVSACGDVTPWLWLINPLTQNYSFEWSFDAQYA